MSLRALLQGAAARRGATADSATAVAVHRAPPPPLAAVMQQQHTHEMPSSRSGGAYRCSHGGGPAPHSNWYAVGPANRRSNMGMRGSLFYRPWHDGVGAEKERLERGPHGATFRKYASPEEALSDPRMRHLKPMQVMSRVAWEGIPRALRTADNVTPPHMDSGDGDDAAATAVAPTAAATPPLRKRLRATVAQEDDDQAPPRTTASASGRCPGLILATDGSAGSRNGQRNAPCGLGIVCARMASASSSLVQVLFEEAVAGPQNFGGCLAPTLAVHTSPRAEWLAMCHGLTALVAALGQSDALAASARQWRLTLACDNTGVVYALERQLARGRVGVVTDETGLRNAATNADVKVQTVNLLHLCIVPRFREVRVLHTPAHLTKAQQTALATSDPFLALCAELNARADELAGEGAAQYDKVVVATTTAAPAASST